MTVLIVSFLAICIVAYLILNAVYKRSVAYKNANLAINKFKGTIPSSLQLVNFGSTYAMYAFNIYEDLKLNAFNFSIDAQSLEIDDCLLRKYTSNIAPGATVIFGLAACVTYYRYSMVSDKTRYYEFLGKQYIPDYSYARALRNTFPLTMGRMKSMVVSFLKGNEEKTIYSGYTSQLPLQKMEANMKGLADGWIKLFHLKDLKQKDNSIENNKNKDFNTALLRKVFDYCLNRGWKPVVVIPPFSGILNQYFGNEFVSGSLKAMIEESRMDLNIEVLDYRLCPAFQNDYGLYLDGGFRLNKRGSEMFVKMVLNDLNAKGHNLTNSSIGC